MSEKKSIPLIYKTLYKHYGPQGWWPIIDKNYNVVYRKNFFGKLSEDEMFEISIGAILTQNVSWLNAQKSLVNLKREGLLKPEKLLCVNDSKIYTLIRSSGYYKQKTLKIKEFCKFLARYNFSIKKMLKNKPNEIREELLKVKGIGRETADSILLYAGYIPFFVVDAYTKRLLERIFSIGIKDYDDIQNLFHENLPQDYRIFNEYHALIVEHSKNICLKNKPICGSCILKNLCNYFKRFYGNRRKTKSFDRK